MQAFEGSQVFFLKTQKKFIELRLGEALYKCFEKDDRLMTPLRYYVMVLMQEVWELTAGANGCLFRARLLPAFKDEQHLAVWELVSGGYPWEKWFKVLDVPERWTPAHCADLLRLYGKIVTALGGENGLKVEKLAQQNNATLLQEISAEWQWRDKQRRKFRDDPVHQAFSKDERARTDTTDTDKWPKGYVGPRPGTMKRLHQSMQSDNENPPRKPGISRWKLADKDTTKAISALFGLYEGGSTSGTTSNTLFSLYLAEKYRQCSSPGFSKPPRNVLLVPFSTMVWSGHHTILEIALAYQLALNKDHRENVRYLVDFYSTLTPENEQGANLRAILKEYETLMDDFHLIVVRNKGKEKAYRMETADEKRKFKKFADLHENMDLYRQLKFSQSQKTYGDTLLNGLEKAGLWNCKVKECRKADPQQGVRQWSVKSGLSTSANGDLLMEQSVKQFLAA